MEPVDWPETGIRALESSSIFCKRRAAQGLSDSRRAPNRQGFEVQTRETTPLCSAPKYRRDDLGQPLPDSPHAASVALPLWEHVVGYEEGRPDIIAAMKLGYPRFVLHPLVQELFSVCAQRFASAGESAYAFPSRRSADSCAAFMGAKGAAGVSVHDFGYGGIHAVVFPEGGAEWAKAYWQHFGQIISSRLAEAALAQRPVPDAAAARSAILAQLAELAGTGVEDVYLFPSGMAAMSHAIHLTHGLRPGARSIQLGFPYVDVLKCQSVWGPGVAFLPFGNEFSIDAVARHLAEAPVAAVVCEFPGNPLLQGPDLAALSACLRAREVPLIVDDTPSTFVNIDALRYADMVITSLTKTYSGAGDIMAGSVVLNPRSPFYKALSAAQSAAYEDLFWAEDAIVLASSAENFVERTHQINAAAFELAEFLRAHPAVERVYYPAYEMGPAYDQIMKPGGGYGGLFSMLLRDAERTAPLFYDSLEISKGPSLGTNFSLVCPYTLLAHFKELDWAESHGVSRYLIRVSVGLEAAADLIERFSRALEMAEVAGSRSQVQGGA